MPQLKDGSIMPETFFADPKNTPDYVPARAFQNIWACPGGHVLGVIVREKVDHIHTRPRLLLFRGALDPNEPANHAVPFAKVDSGDVICGICGAEKTWYAGQDVVDKLRGPSIEPGL